MSIVRVVPNAEESDVLRRSRSRDTVTNLAGPTLLGTETDLAIPGDSALAGLTGIICPVIAPRARWAADADLPLEVDLWRSDCSLQGEIGGTVMSLCKNCEDREESGVVRAW